MTSRNLFLKRVLFSLVTRSEVARSEMQRIVLKMNTPIRTALVFWIGLMALTAQSQECQVVAEAVLTPGAWPDEISWMLASEDGEIVAEGNNPSGTDVVTEVCLDSTACYLLFLHDSFGDGWNGATLTFNAEEMGWMSEAYTLEAGTEGVFNVGIADCGSGNPLEVYGCTDPAAWNYNPWATVEDGSCDYDFSGGGDCDCDSSLYAPVCAFDLFTGSLGEFDNPCFAECEGWLVIADGSCESNEVTGCTDPEASNYNPYASQDDGSCIYPCGEGSELGLLYVCTFQQGANVGLSITNNETAEVIYEESGYANFAIEYLDLCLEAGCYTATLTNLAGETGWYNGYFYINSNAGQIIYASLSDDATEMSIQFSTDGSCGDILGCTDPEAPNFNAAATVDDGSCLPPCNCEGLPYEPVCAYDPATWELTTFDNACEAECIGAYIQFNGDCENPPIYGCTDPEALNYNEEATEDNFSCIYPLVCEDDETLVTITSNTLEVDSNIFGQDFGAIPAVSWSLGDSLGWGVYMEYWYDENQVLVSQGCLADGCYNFLLSYSGWEWYDIDVEAEDLYAIVTIDGESTNYFYDAEEFGVTYYGLGINVDDCEPYVPIHGCTDPDADNFNPEANIDDGSCYYSVECDPGELTLTAVVIPGTWGEEMFFNIYNDTGELILSGEGGYNDLVYQTCVMPGCFTFYAGDTFGDGWDSGFVLLDWETGGTEFFLATGSEDLNSFGVDTDCGDDPTPIVGCTDMGATNYNPFANEDDGSCEFAFCPTNQVTFVTVMLQNGPGSGWLIGDETNPAMGGFAGMMEGTQTWTACMASGCYEVNMWDNEDDGWNGGWLEVWMDNALITTATLEDGSGGTMTLGIDEECGDGDIDGWGFGGSPFEWPDPIGLVPFPNPTEGEWNFDGSGFNAMKPLNIRMMDLSGKVVMDRIQSFAGGQVRVDASGLSSGWYTIEVVQDQQRGRGALSIIR